MGTDQGIFNRPSGCCGNVKHTQTHTHTVKMCFLVVKNLFELALLSDFGQPCVSHPITAPYLFLETHLLNSFVCEHTHTVTYVLTKVCIYKSKEPDISLKSC